MYRNNYNDNNVSTELSGIATGMKEYISWAGAGGRGGGGRHMMPHNHWLID